MSWKSLQTWNINCTSVCVSLLERLQYTWASWWFSAGWRLKGPRHKSHHTELHRRWTERTHLLPFVPSWLKVTVFDALGAQRSHTGEYACSCAGSGWESPKVTWRSSWWKFCSGEGFHPQLPGSVLHLSVSWCSPSSPLSCHPAVYLLIDEDVRVLPSLFQVAIICTAARSCNSSSHINNGSVPLSVRGSCSKKWAQYQGPGTGSPQWNTVTHPSHLLILWSHLVTGANPSWHWMKGTLHLGQVARQSRGRHIGMDNRGGGKPLTLTFTLMTNSELNRKKDFLMNLWATCFVGGAGLSQCAGGSGCLFLGHHWSNW